MGTAKYKQPVYILVNENSFNAYECVQRSAKREKVGVTTDGSIVNSRKIAFEKFHYKGENIYDVVISKKWQNLR